MGDIFARLDPFLLVLLFSGIMLGAWGIGWRIVRRAKPEPEEDPGARFTDAALALLGLLLAFTFSLSLARHD
jgi:hypothetical protein